MPDPVRLKIMKELCRQIEERAGLGGMVFRGRSHFGPSASGGITKMVSVFEDGARTEDFPEQTGNGKATVVNLPLMLFGYDVEDFDNPTDPAQIMMDQVLRAIRSIKRDGAARGEREQNYLGMGRIVAEIAIGSGHVFPAFANNDTEVAFWLLPITLRYVETLD